MNDPIAMMTKLWEMMFLYEGEHVLYAPIEVKRHRVLFAITPARMRRYRELFKLACASYPGYRHRGGEAHMAEVKMDIIELIEEVSLMEKENQELELSLCFNSEGDLDSVMRRAEGEPWERSLRDFDSKEEAVAFYENIGWKVKVVS